MRHRKGWRRRLTGSILMFSGWAVGITLAETLQHTWWGMTGLIPLITGIALLIPDLWAWTA